MSTTDFEHKHPRGRDGRFRVKRMQSPPAIHGKKPSVESRVPLHMPRPVQVEVRDGFRIWVRFDDGIEGVADLSGIAGRGVFSAWDDRSFFETVHVHPARRAVVWGPDHDLDLDPDRLYMEITGVITSACIP